MPINITDRATDRIVREFAAARKLTITEAVRVAVMQALRFDKAQVPVEELLADVHARIQAAAPSGEKADKAFFDKEWGH
jgi:antitoxin VapB